MERIIIRAKKRERLSNLKIRNMSGIRDCRYIVKKLKFDYAGHVAGGDENRWEKAALEWCPIDRKRKAGRPKS